MKTTLEQNDTNKLIAEFMGLENPFNEINDATLYRYKSIDEKGEFEFDIELHEMRYHLSWDWLMPVVSKCYNNNTIECNELSDITHALIHCNIDEVYISVVVYIQKYNQ